MKDLLVKSKKIAEGGNSSIYLLDEDLYDRPVAVKILKDEFNHHPNTSYIFNEYEHLKSIKHPFIRESIDLIDFGNKKGIALTYFDGQSLKAFLGNEKRTFLSLLKVSIQICEALAYVHDRGIVHRDISPNNVLIDDDGNINLIDFGFATSINMRQNTGNELDHVKGSLPYISPEQTGRTNRVTDHRSDLYSLGAVMYEMFSGHVPFDLEDPMELVHAHLAVMPVSLHQVNPEIPEVVSDIVSKLLSKDMEMRYQSAHGLLVDLKKCLNQVQLSIQIQKFELAASDQYGKLLIPTKLYGREEEIKTLLDSFGRIGPNQKEVTFVEGYSGTGKTSLVYEINRPIAEKKGKFIKGKFEQFRRDTPYFAISQALKAFVNQLLSENEERLKYWKTLIEEAVGSEGKLLIDLIPNLELVIGPQDELGDLGINELRNRFNYVFVRLIKAVAHKSHPLVLFIDDLQWADMSSLELLKTLITEQELSYFYFIGAYRHNEIDDSHPLSQFSQDLSKKGVKVNKVFTKELSEKDVIHFVKDTFACSQSDARGLSKVILSKTAGNPFFIGQLLQSMHERNLIKFNHTSTAEGSGGRWEWDLDVLHQVNFTDNVVGFMIEKIKSFDRTTQDILKLAALIGSRFNIRLLLAANDGKEKEVRKSLWIILQNQLIIPEGSSLDFEHYHETGSSSLEYRFAHDRIRQAAYELMPEKRKRKLHKKIGELLLRQLGDRVDDNIFEITSHLNNGVEDEVSSQERDQLIELNATAGEKAMSSSAYDIALDYFEICIAHSDETIWKTKRTFAFQFHMHAMQCAYLTGHYDRMNALAQVVFGHSESIGEELEAHRTITYSYAAQFEFDKSINHGLATVRKLGVKLPSKPQKSHVITGLLKTKFLLRGKSVESLYEMPKMSEMNTRALMRFITSFAAASYHKSPELFPLVVFKMLQLSIKHGNTSESIPAYGGYGLLLCGATGEIEEGYRYGKLSLDLLEKYPEFKAEAARTFLIFTTFINHWKDPLRDSLPMLTRAYNMGMESGDHQSAAGAIFMYTCHGYMSGENLHELIPKAHAYRKKAYGLQQKMYGLYTSIVLQGILNFQEEQEDVTCLKGEAFDENEFADSDKTDYDRTAQFHILFQKMVLSYSFRCFDKALELSDAVLKELETVTSTVFVAYIYFYDSLCRLAVYDKSSRYQQNKIVRRVKRNQKKLKKWAAHAPDNFMHKLDLVEAELQVRLGHSGKAYSLYRNSMKGALNAQYQNDLALAHELFGRFLIAEKDHDGAVYELAKAYQVYKQWGGNAKAKRLQQEFSFISDGQKVATSGSITSGSFSSVSGTAALDLSTVIKASSTISSEIQLAKAIPSLLNIVIENAGAQTGAFVLVEDESTDKERLLVYATSEAGKEAETIEPVEVKTSGLLPESIVRYVHRTREQVILDDATTDERFSEDEFIKTNKIHSALCLPIIHHRELLGIIYLQNALSKGTFNSERVGLISLLSGQIAITLHNALLYDTLEQKVEERTKEIQQQKNILNRQNSQLTELNNDKDYLISVVSHDLRNPIYLIKGYIDMVMSDPKSDSVREYLEYVLESSNRMEELITRILDTNAINSGELKLNYTDFDLNTMIKKAVQNHQDQANTKSIDLECKLGLDQCEIRSDSSYVSQILDNLISNAIKYTQQKGKVKLTLRKSDTGDFAIITVSDNGQGLSRKDQKLLFSKFQTLSSTPTGGEKSTGLGLSIVKRYVDALQGHIWVESELRQGSAFNVELPLKPLEIG